MIVSSILIDAEGVPQHFVILCYYFLFNYTGFVDSISYWPYLSFGLLFKQKNKGKRLNKLELHH